MSRIRCACISAIKQNPWMNFVFTSTLITNGRRLISVFMCTPNKSECEWNENGGEDGDDYWSKGCIWVLVVSIKFGDVTVDAACNALWFSLFFFLSLAFSICFVLPFLNFAHGYALCNDVDGNNNNNNGGLLFGPTIIYSQIFR